MDSQLVDNPDGVGEAKFQDKKCLDRIRLFLKVEKDKVKKVDTLVEGCKPVRDASKFLVKSLKNKALKGLKIDFKDIKEKHASELAKKTFERTLKNYERFKNDPLEEIIKISQSYDEGYITRDLRYDFEY